MLCAEKAKVEGCPLSQASCGTRTLRKPVSASTRETAVQSEAMGLSNDSVNSFGLPAASAWQRGLSAALTAPQRNPPFAPWELRIVQCQPTPQLKTVRKIDAAVLISRLCAVRTPCWESQDAEEHWAPFWSFQVFVRSTVYLPHSEAPLSCCTS